MSNTVNTKFIEAQNELLKQSAFKGEWSDWKPDMAAAIMMIGVTFIKSKNEPNTEENMRRFALSIANYASKLYEAAGGEVEYSKGREFWIMPDGYHYLQVHKKDPVKSKIAIHGEIIHVIETP